MALESITSGAANTIADLDPTWPLVGDDVGQGDDHIRNIKKALQLTFENVSATVSGVASELAFAHKGGTVSGTALFLFDLNVAGQLSVSASAIFKSGVTIEGGLSVSATIVGHCTSAGEADHAKSASYAISAGFAVSASYAHSALHAVSANYALSALSAQYAVSSQFALYANSCSVAALAKSASYAISALHAVSADYAQSASKAAFAVSASTVNGIKIIPLRCNIVGAGPMSTPLNPFNLSATQTQSAQFSIYHTFGSASYAVACHSQTEYLYHVDVTYRTGRTDFIVRNASGTALGGNMGDIVVIFTVVD